MRIYVAGTQLYYTASIIQITRIPSLPKTTTRLSPGSKHSTVNNIWLRTSASFLPSCLAGASYPLISITCSNRVHTSLSQGFVNPCVNCTVQFTGTKASGETTRMNFTYVATTNPTSVGTGISYLQTAYFNSQFKGLVRLDIVPVVSPATPALTGIDLDLVAYIIRTTT